MELRERWDADVLEDLVEEWYWSPCIHNDYSLHGFIDFTWDEFIHWIMTDEIPWDNFYQLRLF